MYDYLIVGAGISGAIFAHEANKAGKKVLVIDKRDHIAGNIYTKDVDGINVHTYGAHIFHTSMKNVWEYVNTFAEFNNYINSPIAYYKGEIYNLPFNMNTFSRMWNISTPEEAKAKIAEQVAQENIDTPRNLEEQALSLVGRDIFEKLVKGYTEKQWGRDCKDLPASIIKRLPCRFTYDNNYFNDRYQGIPIGGYTAMVEKMLEGIDVQLNLSYQDYVKQYGNNTAKKVIYCGPIDAYFNYSLGHLEYRSLTFEEEKLSKENHQGVAVMNYNEREVPYTRIIEHKHFESAHTPHTVITREYPSSWQPGDEPYYPINDEKNTQLYKEYEELAKKEENIIFAGRLGQYKYYDMDKAIAAIFELIKEELDVVL
ncbi:MAG: UDP-galactopyranose mutase [Actinomycetaceae bacterium]|nr:UDP-galactopyranose mutase [Actinomycetaceae bacterium]